MKLSLTSVAIAKQFSEETLCFAATVCVDDKPAFAVKNHGTGGCNLYMPIGTTPDEILRSRQLMEQAETWARESTGETFEPLDMVIAQLLDRHEVTKTLKSGMRHQIMMMEDGTLFSLKVKGDITPDVVQAAKNRYKNAVVLNDMPLEQAVALVLAA